MAQYQYQYLCSNCLIGWHDLPYCPYRRRPEPRPITPGEMRSMRHLRQLERDGVLTLPRVSQSRFGGGGSLGLVVFIALVILI
jgi:hypothetical protein